MPYRPRRQIEYPNEGLDVNAPTSEVLKKMEPFALYHTSRKLSMEPKVWYELGRLVILFQGITELCMHEDHIVVVHIISCRYDH